MKETFLHYLWMHKLLDVSNLQTVQNEKISILYSGMYNSNAGPDFLNAKLEIGGQLWFGNIEIHLKSSDWYAHFHEEDANYDAVILHVVYEYDVDVFIANNKMLPTLELKGKLDSQVLKNYYELFSQELRWIPCEKEIGKLDSFLMNNWLERLYFERLEEKSEFIEDLLLGNNYDFEATLFQLLAKNFGLKVNGIAFLRFAQTIDFSIVRKVRFNEISLAALFFGQAGFLEDKLEDTFHSKLHEEYAYLKHKFQLKNLSKHQFQFFRIRPSNFPTIRIAQLVGLYYQHQHLFSKLMHLKRVEDFYQLFTVEVHDFWKTHYTFEKESKSSPKKLTKSFIDLLIINTILPLQFVYLKHKGALEEDQIMSLIQQISPEKNSIINKFNICKVTSNSAFDTQALLQLRNKYCINKRCLECAIGNRLLRK